MMPIGVYKKSEEHKRKLSEIAKKQFKNGFPQKTRDKISKALKGKPKPKGFGVGRVMSEEAKRKISLSRRGMVFSQETRKRISKSRKRNYKEGLIPKPKGMLGMKHTFKAKRNISKNHRRHQSEETRKKISLALKGKPATKGSFNKKSRSQIVLPKKDSSIETKIQNFLSLLHIEFFTHKYMNIEHAYQCDIFIPKQETKGVVIPRNTIIECDGCFWHYCEECNKRKITKRQKKQVENDKKRTQELKSKGFRIIRLWGHEIREMELNDFKNKLMEVI